MLLDQRLRQWIRIFFVPRSGPPRFGKTVAMAVGFAVVGGHQFNGGIAVFLLFHDDAQFVFRSKGPATDADLEIDRWHFLGLKVEMGFFGGGEGGVERAPGSWGRGVYTTNNLGWWVLRRESVKGPLADVVPDV